MLLLLIKSLGLMTETLGFLAGQKAVGVYVMTLFWMCKIGIGLQKLLKWIYMCHLHWLMRDFFSWIYLPFMHMRNESHLPNSEPHPSSNVEGLNLMTSLKAVTCTVFLSLSTKSEEREVGRFILPIFKNIFIALSL